MKTKTYTWKSLEDAASSILAQLYNDDWRPDYIVGITRGGLPLAVLLSNLTKTPMYTLDVSLRDSDMGPESNCWMAEDAFGYEEWKLNNYQKDISASAGQEIVQQETLGKNILIVDDINDTGATFNWIVNDWQAGCLPDHDRWNKVFDNNVRFAVMTENLSSEFDKVRYYYDEVNKAEEDCWLVYPWEA